MSADFLKNIIKSRFFIATVIIYAIYIIISNFVDIGDELLALEPYFSNYNKYFGLIINGIQIMIGLVIVLTGFYLGKSHDYKRDYIIKSGEYFETQLRIKFNLNKVKTNVEFDEKEKKYMKNELDEEFVDTDSLKKFILDEGNEIIKDIKEVEKGFKSFPKNVISLSIPTIILLLSIMFYSMINQETGTIYSFFIVVFGMIVTIISFIFTWVIFEKMIEVHDTGLKTLVHGNGILKAINDYFMDILNKQKNS